MSNCSLPLLVRGGGALSVSASGPQRAGDVVSGGGSRLICHIHSRGGGNGTWRRGARTCNSESCTGCPPPGCTAGRSQLNPRPCVPSLSGPRCERADGTLHGRLMARLSCSPAGTTPSVRTHTPPGYGCRPRRMSICLSASPFPRRSRYTSPGRWCPSRGS